jgi:hypothetical protein
MGTDNKPHPLDKIYSNRVYLADFDRVTYSQVAWTDEDIEQLFVNFDRKIKLLLLVKGHVILPVSHLLESELAREVVGPYPDLFACGALVPLLPRDSVSARSFLQVQIDTLRDSDADLYRGSEPEEMAALIDETARYFQWEEWDASQWFCHRFLNDLDDPQSLLRLTLQNNGLELPHKVYHKLSKADHFYRTDIYLATQDITDLDRRELINAYADFLFYLSEALSTGSEGILPQENILDFSMSDLAGGKTHLTEYAVFSKVFIDIVKAATSQHFPADFLDALTIPDAIELHAVAMQNEFIKKYNAIQQTAKDSLFIRDPERLILTLTELETYQRDLHLQFESALHRELPSHRRKQLARSTAKFLHTVATLLIPMYGNMDTTRELFISGLEVIGREDVARRVSRRVSRGIDAVSNLVDRRDVAEKSVLLDFVEKLKLRYMENMTL